MPDKLKASVKVMRSYDYCHFECVLSSDELLDLTEIDKMRKQAAILVDEAVRQYRIARQKEHELAHKEWEKRRALLILETAKKKPQTELTPEEAALLRADHDRSFWKEWDEDIYVYEDEEKELHFSALERFKRTRVQA